LGPVRHRRQPPSPCRHSLRRQRQRHCRQHVQQPRRPRLRRRRQAVDRNRQRLRQQRRVPRQGQPPGALSRPRTRRNPPLCHRHPVQLPRQRQQQAPLHHHDGAQERRRGSRQLSQHPPPPPHVTIDSNSLRRPTRLTEYSL